MAKEKEHCLREIQAGDEAAAGVGAGGPAGASASSDVAAGAVAPAAPLPAAKGEGAHEETTETPKAKPLERKENSDKKEGHEKVRNKSLHREETQT